MTDRSTSPGAVERYHVEVDPEADNDSHALTIELAGSGRRILELGCAGGHVTEWLVRAGNEVVGVEFDTDAAEHARRTGAEIHVLDLDRDLVSDHVSGEFDVIIAADVLEHLRDPIAALDDVLTLLAPDGDVVISVPNLVHGDVRLHVLEGRVDYLDEGLLDRTHLRWFTRESLHDLLDRSGLVAVDVRRTKIGLGGTNLDVDWSLHGRPTLDFVRSDPEHDTFQFVVRAQRSTAAGVGPVAGDDPLAAPTWSWATHSDDELHDLRAQVDELGRYASGLRTALDAVENARSIRLVRGIRRATSRLVRPFRSSGPTA